LRSIQETLQNEDGLPSALSEKISQSKVLIKTLPDQLKAREKYLNDNRCVREEHEKAVNLINKWVKEAAEKLKIRESCIDFDNILGDLAVHKVLMGYVC